MNGRGHRVRVFPGFRPSSSSKQSFGVCLTPPHAVLLAVSSTTAAARPMVDPPNSRPSTSQPCQPCLTVYQSCHRQCLSPQRTPSESQFPLLPRTATASTQSRPQNRSFHPASCSAHHLTRSCQPSQPTRSCQHTASAPSACARSPPPIWHSSRGCVDPPTVLRSRAWLVHQ